MVTHSHCQVTGAPTTRSILNIGGIFVYLLWKCVVINIKKLATFYLALVQAPVEPHGTVGDLYPHCPQVLSDHNRSALKTHLLWLMWSLLVLIVRAIPESEFVESSNVNNKVPASKTGNNNGLTWMRDIKLTHHAVFFISRLLSQVWPNWLKWHMSPLQERWILARDTLPYSSGWGRWLFYIYIHI